MLTKNEKKLLRYLLVNHSSQFSINHIAKECNLSPNGALKILKKFEHEKVLEFVKVGNVKVYALNFSSPKTKLVLQLVLIDETGSKVAGLRKKVEVLSNA